MDYRKMYERWMSFDEDTKNELTGLEEDEIKERFYRDLEFGTGGLRGIIGAGTNRMNIYTVRRATQGIANYMIKKGIKEPTAAIAYDSRKNSEIFAREAALVLNANGIKTFIYSELKPTPMLSYAVIQLKAAAGIVITASHNPKEYNGYKVYWSDGGQVTEEHAEGILKEILNIDYNDIKTIELNRAKELNLFNYIPEDVENHYFELVKGLIIDRELIKKSGRELKIIYTPLHGTGNKPVRRILKELGFENVKVVPEQEMPDCSFSTVKYPNPEEHDAFKLACRMADNDGADLILGTDPDCDRVGVVVKNNNGEYFVLSGNQTGVLLTDYILNALKEKGKLPKNPAIVKTIVTTEMVRKIVSNFDVNLIDVLTGFKYIGEKIKEFEEKGNYNFLFGFEESYGYLAGTFVRDKDGVIACALICEMAAYYKQRGMSLYDALISLYEKYGYFSESLKSLTLKGIEGSLRIKEIMDKLRDNTPSHIGFKKVVRIKDYILQTDKNLVSGTEKHIDLPKSNVLQIYLEDESLITVRPSGTEPKIKFYFAAVGKELEETKDKIRALEEEMLTIIKF